MVSEALPPLLPPCPPSCETLGSSSTSGEAPGDTGTTDSIPDVAYIAPLDPSIVQDLRCLSSLLCNKTTAGHAPTKLVVILTSVER